MADQVQALMSRVGVVEGPCRVYLVRHGTTRMNIENRYRGRRDVPLDAQGYQDAVDAARVLSGAGLTAVYTGPLRRTISTAQIIAHEAGVPDIRILQGLINLGAWEGMTSKEAAMYDPATFELYRSSPLRCVCPNGESLADAQERMRAALELIGAWHQGEAVAAVSHAVMIRLVIARLENLDGEGWRLPVDRGGVIEFHIDNGRSGRVTPVAAGSGEDAVIAATSAALAAGGG